MSNTVYDSATDSLYLVDSIYFGRVSEIENISDVLFANSDDTLQVSDVDGGNIDLVALLDSVDNGAENSVDTVEVTGTTELNISVQDVIDLTDSDNHLVITSADDTNDTIHLDNQIAAAADQTGAPAGYTIYTDASDTVTITIEDTITII
jgi:hypothetical protein